MATSNFYSLDIKFLIQKFYTSAKMSYLTKNKYLSMPLMIGWQPATDGQILTR